MTLRVIDTETCGLDGGVVEVASLDLLDGQLTNPMSDLVSPDRPISLDAMAIHHITEQMVEGKPRIAVAIGRYQGSPYYVAHNAAFDRGVLPEMNGAWICTLAGAHAVSGHQVRQPISALRAEPGRAATGRRHAVPAPRAV